MLLRSIANIGHGNDGFGGRAGPLCANIRRDHVLAIRDAILLRVSQRALSSAIGAQGRQTDSLGGRKGVFNIPLLHRFPSLVHLLSCHCASGNFSFNPDTKDLGPIAFFPFKIPAYPAAYTPVQTQSTSVPLSKWPLMKSLIASVCL